MRLKLFSLAIGALCLLLLTGYGLYRAVPLLLGGVVRLIPLSWEDSLGKAVVAGMTRPGATCDDEATTKLIAAVTTRLQAAMPLTPYAFNVTVVRNPEVNALAAPGGHIVVFSGLIDRMDNADQLAAVLAHEMQHVVQRHSMNSLVRSIGLQALLSIVLGDPGLIGGLAGNLTVLHFMRSDEQSADDEALNTLMRAGIPPAEMQHAFENLDDHKQDAPLKYLSTHPPLAERIARVKLRGAAFQGEAKPISVPIPKACHL